MKYTTYDIVFQEVPNEISLAFSITGCNLRCAGCHSPFLWPREKGTELTDEKFIELIEKYKSMITCVVFMGGEWYPHELNAKLKIAIDCGLKTALYTGESDISQDIMKNLTFLKTGKWIEELGGLNSPRTNQRFLNVKTNKNLNHLFL